MNIIGHPNQIPNSPESLELLRELLNLSQLNISANKDLADELSTVEFQVAPAEGQKCARCWHYELSVGNSAQHPDLCERCVHAVE